MASSSKLREAGFSNMDLTLSDKMDATGSAVVQTAIEDALVENKKDEYKNHL
jgi:hypothetical protein